MEILGGESRNNRTVRVVPRGQLRESNNVARIQSPLSPQCTEPHIEVIRENGCVQQIRIECACGERIVLSCEYESQLV